MQKEIGHEENHQRKDEKTKKTIGNEENHKRNEDKSKKKQEMKKIIHEKKTKKTKNNRK